MCDAYSELKFWAENEFGTQNLKKKSQKVLELKECKKWPNMKFLTVAIDRWILGVWKWQKWNQEGRFRGGGGKYNWEN